MVNELSGDFLNALGVERDTEGSRIRRGFEEKFLEQLEARKGKPMAKIKVKATESFILSGQGRVVPKGHEFEVDESLYPALKAEAGGQLKRLDGKDKDEKVEDKKAEK